MTWEGFLTLVGEYFSPSAPKSDANQAQEQFNKMMAEYFRQQSAKPVSVWAETFWNKVCEAGIMDGSAPHGFLTREQAATLIYRLCGMDKE